MARFKLRLSGDQFMQFAFQRILIEQLARGHLVALVAHGCKTVLIGVLHIRLLVEQTGQHLVAENEINR